MFQIRQTRPAFALDAFGHELRLWRAPGDDQWDAMLDDGKQVIYTEFQADDVITAKLRLSTEARERAICRWKDREFPSCESLLDSWNPVTIVEPL